MLKKVKTHTDIGWIELLLEPFIPLGYNNRKQRVAWWPGKLRRHPVRYINNNGLLFLAIALYDTVHQGPAWWTLVHLALGAPSLFVLYKALVVWHEQLRAEGEDD